MVENPLLHDVGMGPRGSIVAYVVCQAGTGDIAGLSGASGRRPDAVGRTTRCSGILAAPSPAMQGVRT